VGVLRGPGVDGLAGLFRVRLEIERGQGRLVQRADGLLECGFKGEALLHPEAIGDGQLVAAPVCLFDEFRLDRCDGGVVARPGMRLAERGGDAGGSLAARAIEQHGERGRDAEGRQNQVAAAGGQLPVCRGRESMHARSYVIGGEQRARQQKWDSRDQVMCHRVFHCRSLGISRRRYGAFSV
jgi:hypothetical protein